ncbi:hypothetical protein PAXRUDRAFT_175477 [Paxillus rubicundulus Ve08.2h10]|uniref:Uncharacterized protein n=1 Tax=Paxillus rubicundulus Ve08.2h10 TaxID=930991 RepID=A0A0D0CGY7_9AGAM|nr:hypothetical protein PAXRUDRAFT_175477 [Paxillus rubicundulus Ve08.2h10]
MVQNYQGIRCRYFRHCPTTLHRSSEGISPTCPTYAPLFSYKTSSGWEPLTKTSFILQCNDVWVQNGSPSMPGHAFCISGTTELLSQGINLDIITVQGRWTSQAFLDYWCWVESVLPLFISSSVDINCLQHVDDKIQ